MTRIQTLEAQVHAAGRAFACEEAAYEQRFVAHTTPGKMLAVALAAGSTFMALMHFIGLSGWRAAA